MAVYSVHLPGAGAAGKKPDAAEAAFVREAFCWRAFFFGPFWLLAQGFWLWAALWCVVILALLSAAGAGILSSSATLTLIFLVQLLLGLQAPRLIEQRLWRHGYDLAEVVVAPGLEAAEMDFYRGLGPHDEAGTHTPASLTSSGHPPPPSSVIGSFPAPEA